MSETTDQESGDRRLLRGARSRRTILRRAVDVASVEGLDGLSFGALATGLGLSKSGVQTLFATKENLQTATAEHARKVFDEAVVRPALSAGRGAARLRALVEAWIGYASEPLFPGGCFWAANQAAFDGRPGPVHDALFAGQRDWRRLLAGEVRHATGASPDAAALAAFQLDAVLLAANTALRCGDRTAVDSVRQVTEALLATPIGAAQQPHLEKELSD
ncbi:TetR/AcrR family transcriptional regulator [Streptomyces sp. NPDC049813]|uniref:TetR/AcrR family transcriptional regulator n=1 Tax=Streptomyces sp. NPDC049813 TaxID=3365597 RepID=UPI0037B55BD3